MARRLVLLTLTLLVAAPAVAQAAPFTDRVTTTAPSAKTSRLQAKAAQAATGPIRVPIASGESVRVEFTAAAGDQPAVAAAYVAFLDALPHGTELARLNLLIAAPGEVAGLCGGSEDDGILACYGGADQQMIVPSSGLDAVTADGGYTVRYVLTHEYGHHIAANRSNNLGGTGALDYGPKYWSSYELVCDRTDTALPRNERLFPGDEESNYRANPGEAWAEVYARLTFPEQRWTFTPLLVPDAAAIEAARRDVLTPWTGNTTTTFTMAAGRNSQTFDLPLTLDGTLRAKATAPRGAKISVRLSSGPQKVAFPKSKRTANTWSLAGGCREEPTETVSFTVKRQGGASGPVALNVSYAG